MHSSWSWASVVVLSAWAAEAHAQMYTIKLKSEPDAGMTVTIHDTHKEEGSMKLVSPDGKILNEVKPNKGRELAYSLTILSKGKGTGPAQQFKRVYDTATETEEGKRKTLSYQRRIIVFDWSEGTYRIGVVGKPPLDGKDLDDVLKKANDNATAQVDGDRAITPAKQVALNQTWTVDPMAIQGLMKEIELDPKKSRAQAKLVKVYSKGKSQFGVIEVDFQLAVKALPPIIKFNSPATMQLKGTFDLAIDGSSTARKETWASTLKGKGMMQQGENKIAIEMDGVMSGSLDRSEEKDDAKARVVPKVEFVGPGGQWEEFASKEGRFTALFPGKPKIDTKKDATDNVTTTCQVPREQGNIIYQVVYTDFAQVDPKVNPKVVVKSAADNLAKAINAKLTKENKEITRNGHAGLEMLGETEQSGFKMAITLQVYYIKGRLYQVMVINVLGVKEKVEVKKFLDSFQLHEKKESKEPKKEGPK